MGRRVHHPNVRAALAVIRNTKPTAHDGEPCDYGFLATHGR